jgi:hypothetical protein
MTRLTLLSALALSLLLYSGCERFTQKKAADAHAGETAAEHAAHSGHHEGETAAEHAEHADEHHEGETAEEHAKHEHAGENGGSGQ